MNPLREIRLRLAHWKLRAGQKRLQRLIDERKRSDDVVGYRVRRAAALKGLGRA
jgi:hypothetical protein